MRQQEEEAMAIALYVVSLQHKYLPLVLYICILSKLPSDLVGL